jgi:hypothetical protein
MEVCPLSRGVILPSCATPVRLITRRLSLFPSSFARTPIGSPHGSLSHSGEIRVYHVPQMRPDGLGLAYTPVARASAVADFGASTLATYLLVQASQPVWLVRSHDACGDSHSLTIPSTLAPDRFPAGSRSFLSRFGCQSLTIEVTLSRELHTPPLPAAHVPVGYLRQNAR